MDQPHDKLNTSRSLFDDAASKEGDRVPLRAAAPQAPAAPGKRFLHIVLPAAIFVVGVAFIAWVAQNQPGRDRPTPAPKNTTVLRDVLDFTPKEFLWDRENPKYVPEFELATNGFYDYEFTNKSNNDVDLGVMQTSCTCSSVEVCIFQSTEQQAAYRAKHASHLPWVKLDVDKDLRKKVVVPGNASGVVRIAWKGNKSEPELMRIATKLWTRAGPGQDPHTKDQYVLVNYVRPVLFEQERIDLGSLGPKDQRTATFHCWSATRDIDVKPAGDDKRIKVETTPLTAEERQALQDKLGKGVPLTRVRSAAKVKITLYEQVDGKQLDMGLMLKTVPLAITSGGQPVAVPLPLLRASVRGDVTLSAQEEGGKIDLGLFSAKDGTTKKVRLFAPKDAKLIFLRCEPILLELDLDVDVTEGPTDAGKTQWEMKISVRPDRDPGPLQEDAVLVLQCELLLNPSVLPGAEKGNAVPTTQKRLVRIPLLGTAVR